MHYPSNSSQLKILAAVASLHLAILNFAGEAFTPGFISVALAQAETATASAETIAKNSVTDAVAAGQRVLLVELHGSTLYVFNTSNKVGGPVLRVLDGLGFRPVLPDGVDVGASGVTSLSIEQLKRASAEHVFLLNFSTSESAVREVEGALRPISNGRLYRLNTTTSVALSEEWTEDYLLPRVTEAIRAEGTAQRDM